MAFIKDLVFSRLLFLKWGRRGPCADFLRVISNASHMWARTLQTNTNQNANIMTESITQNYSTACFPVSYLTQTLLKKLLNAASSHHRKIERNRGVNAFFPSAIAACVQNISGEVHEREEILMKRNKRPFSKFPRTALDPHVTTMILQGHKHTQWENKHVC